MARNIKILIIRGKDLTQQDLEFINYSRKIEFGSESIIDPQPDNEDWDKIYFLAKSGDKLLAFGRLHKTEVTFMDKKYSVLGIATIAVSDKGKGIGKLLVLSMKKYIQEKEETGLGFCAKFITPFYIKCGLNVIIDGQKRFSYPAPSMYPDDDAIYIPGKNKLIEIMEKYPNEVAYLSRPHW